MAHIGESVGQSPKLLQIDNSSAATHQISGEGKRDFNPEFRSLAEHYALAVRTIQVGCPNENGDVESHNGHLKRRLEQHLLLRGHRDFASEAAFRVGFFNATHGLLQCLADVGGHFAHVVPMAIVGDLKPIILRKLGVFFIACGLGQRGLIFLVMDIGDSLKKKERENVGLEISGVHRAAQDVGRFPEVGFELREGDIGTGTLAAGELEIHGRIGNGCRFGHAYYYWGMHMSRAVVAKASFSFSSASEAGTNMSGPSAQIKKSVGAIFPLLRMQNPA